MEALALRNIELNYKGCQMIAFRVGDSIQLNSEDNSTYGWISWANNGVDLELEFKPKRLDKNEQVAFGDLLLKVRALAVMLDLE